MIYRIRISFSEVLWGLVNNAGVSQYGAVEWVSMDDYRNICEVNLFGTIAVTKAFLPLIRSAKGENIFVKCQCNSDNIIEYFFLFISVISMRAIKTSRKISSKAIRS